MTMFAAVAARRSQYNRDAILQASPVRLLTMLYDRLMLDLGRAESAQLAENWPVATQNLLHAQAIVAELSSTLNMTGWDGAEGLFALYTYAGNAMATANIHRDVARTRESILLLEPLRQSWHEAAASLPVREAPAAIGTLGFA